MAAMLSNLRGRATLVALAIGVVSLLGAGTAVSTAEAQSDLGVVAPWQAHPDQGQEVPPPANPCDAGGGCGLFDGCRTCNSGCGDPCEEECNPATDWLHMFERRGAFRFRGEYLAWWTKSSDLPPLLTTFVGATPPAIGDAGALTQPGTEVLFGGSDADSGTHSGARMTLGYWFTPCHETGLDITYTTLGDATMTYRRNGSQNSVLSRPYLDVDPNNSKEYTWPLAYPDTPNNRNGAITITSSQELNFVEALVRWCVLRRCENRLDLLLGYRYGRFAESLGIQDQTTNLLGNEIRRTDQFDATNEFNGFEMGLVASTRRCRWSFEGIAKLAVGNTRSRVDIDGHTIVTPGPLVLDGGLLALPSNFGSTERNSFSAVPEFGLNVGYDLTRNLRAMFGYTFVYWSSVMRPGDQIDTRINGSRIPPASNPTGAQLPERKSVTTDFWAQGVNAGLEYRY